MMILGQVHVTADGLSTMMHIHGMGIDVVFSCKKRNNFALCNSDNAVMLKHATLCISLEALESLQDYL